MVTLRLTGHDAAAGRKVTIWRKDGGKRIKLGVVTSGKNKKWTFSARLLSLKATIWASDGKSSGAKLTVKVHTSRDATTRGC